MLLHYENVLDHSLEDKVDVLGVACRDFNVREPVLLGVLFGFLL